MKIILAENQPASLDDVTRNLKKLSTRVRELLKLQTNLENQLAVHASGMFLEITPTAVKDSPPLDVSKADQVKIKNIDKLRKNYTVLKELFAAKTELEVMEIKLKTTFRDKKPEKALNEIGALKKEVSEGITRAFSFISDLAKSHIPPVLEKFSNGISSALSKSILYKEGRVFTYVFENEGDLLFTIYHLLKNVEDDKGRLFPELYLTATYRTGNEPQMFVGIQHNFAPPSKDLLMKKVKNLKDALLAYNHLLELDDVSNTLGNLPLQVLLDPKTISRDRFSFRDQVSKISIDEREIVFHLRSTAVDNLDVITAQLFKELNVLQRSKNAKLRMSPRKTKNGALVAFRFVMSDNSPPVNESDLEFLKDRFNIDQDTLKNVVRVINLGS